MRNNLTKHFAKMAMALVALWPMSLTACSDDDGGDGNVQPSDIIIPDVYRQLTFPASGGEQNVVVQSPIDLTATTSVDWLSVESVASASTKMKKFSVICQPTTTGKADSATITLSASNFSDIIKVKRLSGAIISLASDSVITISADGGSLSVSVGANEEPTAESDSWWLTTAKSEAADGTYTFTLAAAKNLTTSERDAYVTVSNTGGKVRVRIHQAAGDGASTAGMPSDAKTLVSKIFAGINIGNTMECPGPDKNAEGSWCGAKVNSQYIAGLKAAGFNAVRIPSAWHSYIVSGSKNYEIAEWWMARVKEVVDYCVSLDMYVVLNSHWDTGWLEDNIFNTSKESAILAEQTAIWTQIATYFRDYDEHLIFSGCNEPGMNETSSGGKKWDDASVARLVSYEQAFIDAVRATGGNNEQRCLVFQGLGTDISSTADNMNVLPTDPAGRLIAEVHFYEPYQWALMQEDASWGKVFWYWGAPNHKDGSAHNPTWGEEQHVKDQFEKMLKNFVGKGIPVIVGEYSSQIQNHTDESETFDAELHKTSRAYYNEVVTREAKNHGCAPFYWETGSEINRQTGAVKLQYSIDGIMRGAEAGEYPF